MCGITCLLPDRHTVCVINGSLSDRHTVYVITGFLSDHALCVLPPAYRLIYVFRYPIMVDPQGQGLTWTRDKEIPNGLMETNSSDRAFRNVLEDCLAYGKPLLLSNVEEVKYSPTFHALLPCCFQIPRRHFSLQYFVCFSDFPASDPALVDIF